MTSIRTVLRSIAAAMLLAIFALPASADNKSFSIQVPSSLGVGSGLSTSVSFTNNANGNSSFNSITLSVTGNLTITNASVPAAAGGSRSALPAQSVTFTNLSPTKTGETLVVSLTVTTTNGSCANGSVVWLGDAWTGSPTSPSNHFTLLTTQANRTTIIAPTCKYSLTALPTQVAAGTSTPFTATLTNDSTSTANIASLTLTAPANLSITSTNPIAGLNLAPGASTTISGTVSNNCSATSGNWDSTAKSSGSVTFTRTNALGTTTLNPVCTYKYSLSGIFQTVPAGTSTTFPVTVANDGTSAGNITSVTLTPPAGLTIANASYAVNVAPGTSSTILVTVNNNCTATSGSWGSTGTYSGGPTVGPTGISSSTTALAAPCSYKYSLSGFPSSLPAGTSKPFTVTVANDSTSAVNLTSLTLTPPTGLTITNANYSVNVAPGTSTTVLVTANNACAATSGTWNSIASGSSVTFTRTSIDVSTTNASPACSLQIVQPQNVVAGAVFSVDVKALDGTGGLFTFFSGPVTLTLDVSSALAGGGPQSTPGGGVVTFPAVTISPAGQYTLTATSAAGSAIGSVSVSSSFTVFNGIILCGEGLTGINSNPPDALPGDQVKYPPTPPSVGFARGMRGPNKDGSACPNPGGRIPYTFTNTVLDDNTVILDWDAIAAPYAVFRYQVTLQDEPVGVDGLPSGTTVLLFPDTAGGTKIRRVGVACLSSDFPGPLGNLNAAISDTAGSLTVNGIATVPKSPIAIWVTSTNTASGGERMEVAQASVSGTGPFYDVTYNILARGDGSTTKVPHLQDAPVFITPLPVDPNEFLPGGTRNFYFEKQVSMCIISEKWEATGGTLLRPTIDVFDIGDGGISRFSE